MCTRSQLARGAVAALLCLLLVAAADARSEPSSQVTVSSCSISCCSVLQEALGSHLAAALFLVLHGRGARTAAAATCMHTASMACIEHDVG